MPSTSSGSDPWKSRRAASSGSAIASTAISGPGPVSRGEGVGEPLAEKGGVRAAGGVQDGDRVGHESTVKPPLQGRVKG